MLRRLLARLFRNSPSGQARPADTEAVSAVQVPELDPTQAPRPAARVFDPPPLRPDDLSDTEVDMPVMEDGEWRGE